MADTEHGAPSNADLGEPGNRDEDKGDMGEGNRPAGGDKAAHPEAVGQHPDKMRERGTVDPDKPDPSGGPPG
jgi:hypothetical protein